MLLFGQVAFWGNLNRMDRFQLVKKVGEGAFSNVYQAVSIHSGTVVALKKLHVQKFATWEECCKQNEICVLLALKGCQYVTQVLEFGREASGECFFVMKLERGSLLELIHDKGPFEETQLKVLARHVLLGLVSAPRELKWLLS